MTMQPAFRTRIAAIAGSTFFRTAGSIESKRELSGKG
jgi:hypothetical protein